MARGENTSRGPAGRTSNFSSEKVRERRGDWPVSTRQSQHIEAPERERRSGAARYDAGPGTEGLPGARDMDRPPSECGTYARTGERRERIERGIETIQDQDPRGRR